ncbi:hypothetical protein EYF80_017150 [Liparis tanakae]|uniref:Uncharacterized protein n=1 Tax=Liparis tanakae TaxID=230148 RepID=A0A4Z2I4K4_9TELE|nr:hypothetical protein EYF80_017150 [Liparis tanakae]
MKEEKCGWQDRRMSTVILEPSEALKRGNCERISLWAQIVTPTTSGAPSSCVFPVTLRTEMKKSAPLALSKIWPRSSDRLMLWSSEYTALSLIIQPNGSRCCDVTWQRTLLPDDDGLGSGEAELATNHVGLRQVPAVVTHRPPCPVVVDLHAAVCSAAAEQPRVPVLRPTFRFPLKQKVRLMVAQQFFGKLPRPNLFEDDATFELNT